MDIVQFAEEFIGLELMDFQKMYLTRLYDIYKKDPESFNKFMYPCCRRYTPFDPMLLLVTIFDQFNKTLSIINKRKAEIQESEDCKKNES